VRVPFTVSLVSLGRSAGSEIPSTTRRGFPYVPPPNQTVPFPSMAAAMTAHAETFVAAAAKLSWLCFVLSPVALIVIFWYSLAKRYTWATQFFLGLAMAVAPVGGWLAAGGGAGWEPWMLGLAIALWVGGFDVLYACQDLEVDRRQHLKSIPVRFGVARSLGISRAMHVGTIACLALLGFIAGLGPVYFFGVAAVAGLLAYEQSLVSATDLSNVKLAFDLNGYVGILYFLITAISVYAGR